ncbi:hypothetical protein [Paraferrimonas sp. SM1919]|uniref:hypothetical protein n=1 Tax=Paraferrimonas sp. SM1919 TaxID=2662263 RepID=UPI0013D005F5|nr:hypothetical protein [Paraferrimonas sp. SM1919]
MNKPRWLLLLVCLVNFNIAADDRLSTECIKIEQGSLCLVIQQDEEGWLNSQITLAGSPFYSVQTYLSPPSLKAFKQQRIIMLEVAEEGHPSQLFFDFQQLNDVDSELEPIYVLADYYFEHIEHLSDGVLYYSRDNWVAEPGHCDGFLDGADHCVHGVNLYSGETVKVNSPYTCQHQ